MRKVLLIMTAGFAALVGLSTGPASARVWACTHDFLFPITCRWAPDPPPKPTTPWQGSPAGYGKPIQELKLKRAL